ncbi:MAG TPA: M15 family metallopeptidase [Nevskiaceae bacterium]|nr:M15 family metallopeptidase [Nevskiaceae bacterium]
MNAVRDAYRTRIVETLRALGADPALAARRGLPVHREAQTLTLIGLGSDLRDKFATPATATAYRALHTAATKDGVALLLHSAFRSFDYQLSLIRYKVAHGRSLDEVLRVNAPPGCSEHHSGRALDLGCVGTPALEESFETTEAFAWLGRHAARFGFRLSFPRDNRYGFLYEPWHWYFLGVRARRRC